MDKQKQIEEMVKELAKDMGIAFQLANTTRFGVIADDLIRIGYRKIPENAVVLTKEKETKLFNDYVEYIKKVRKETAEKFAERLKSKYGKSCSEYYPELITLNSEQLDEICKEIKEVE